MRDNFLDLAKKARNNLLCQNLHKSWPRDRFFINEILPPPIKKILYESKIYAKDKGFKFVWVSNGKVLLRKQEGSKIYRIDHLKKLTLI